MNRIMFFGPQLLNYCVFAALEHIFHGFVAVSPAVLCGRYNTAVTLVRCSSWLHSCLDRPPGSCFLPSCPALPCVAGQCDRCRIAVGSSLSY